MGLNKGLKSYGTPTSTNRRNFNTLTHTLQRSEERSMDECGRASELDSSTAVVSLFASISQPVLINVDPVKVSKFLNDRELYELNVEQKKNELFTVTVTTYTWSIDRTHLKHVMFLGEFTEDVPDKTAEQITSDNIKQFHYEMVKKVSSGSDPQCIRTVLKGLHRIMHITDSNACVLHLASCFFSNTSDKLATEHSHFRILRKRLNCFGCQSLRLILSILQQTFKIKW